MSKVAERSQQIEATAQDMKKFVRTAQRKLLEFEVLMSTHEIKRGESTVFKTTDDLMKEL
jgi:hypothetical protein